MYETIPSLPQYVFISWCLVKHRDKLLIYTGLSDCYVEIIDRF